MYGRHWLTVKSGMRLDALVNDNNKQTTTIFSPPRLSTIVAKKRGKKRKKLNEIRRKRIARQKKCGSEIIPSHEFKNQKVSEKTTKVKCKSEKEIIIGIINFCNEVFMGPIDFHFSYRKKQKKKDFF